MAVHMTERPSGLFVSRDVADGTQSFTTGVELIMSFAHYARWGSDFEWSSGAPTRMTYRGRRPLVVLARALFSARRSAGVIASVWAFTLLLNGVQEGPRLELPQSGGPGSFGSHGIGSGGFPPVPVLMEPDDYLEWSLRQFTGSGWVSGSLWAEVLSTGWGAD